MTDRFVWASNDRVEYRWTVFSPGYIITTFYPEGYTLDWWHPDTGRTGQNRTWIGWRVNPYLPLSSNGYPLPIALRQELVTTTPTASLILPLRTLRARPAVRLEAYAPALPDALTDQDAWNFDDQLRTLASALEKIGAHDADPNCRRLVWEVVKDEGRSIAQAGFDHDVRRRYEELRRAGKSRFLAESPEQREDRVRELLLSR
jgi:hypothetical protein